METNGERRCSVLLHAMDMDVLIDSLCLARCDGSLHMN